MRTWLCTLFGLLLGGVVWAEPSAPAPAGKDTSAELPSRAWHLLAQTDSNHLLYGLRPRLEANLLPSRRATPVWQGVDAGGEAEIVLESDADLSGEIVLGFFADPRWWLAEPVQMRGFASLGTHQVERLPAGTYAIGGFARPKQPNPHQPDQVIFGIAQDWPQCVEIQPGRRPTIRVRFMAQANEAIFGHQFPQSGFRGVWPLVDPRRLITVRTVDEHGKPRPYCRVVITSLTNEGRPHQFFDLGSDAMGMAYCDEVDGPFRVLVQAFDFLPDTMAGRYRVTALDEIYDARTRPSLTLKTEPMPAGDGVLRGRVHDQHGRPLSECYVTLTQETADDAWRKRPSAVMLPVTDREGRFEVRGLAPATYRVTARNFDYATHVQAEPGPKVEIAANANAAAEIDIEVEARSLYYGRAIDADGQPHPVLVQAQFRVGKDPWDFSAKFSTHSDPDGSFRVPLSQEDTKLLMENFGGQIDLIDRADQKNRAQIHLEKLSTDPRQPTPIALKRSAAKTERASSVPGPAEPTDVGEFDVRPGLAKPVSMDFTLVDTTGQTWRAADLRGKPALVSVFATYCGPCYDELRDFTKLRADISAEELLILAVSKEEEVEEVENFARRNRLGFPVLTDPENKLVASFYDDESWPVPLTVLLDRNGQVVYRCLGYREGQVKELFAELGKLLGRELPLPERP